MCDVVDHMTDIVVDNCDIRDKRLWLGMLLISGRGNIELGVEIISCLKVWNGIESSNMFG